MWVLIVVLGVLAGYVAAEYRSYRRDVVVGWVLCPHHSAGPVAEYVLDLLAFQEEMDDPVLIDGTVEMLSLASYAEWLRQDVA